jgi:HAE1 family hydrophobic/amphiphilic exporter-1
MVMLAIVVLGLFSYQRLKVDQFPNIDFPVVVVTAEYPGASPEIVESEVTKKIEEGVNSIAGINALTSRSYEGSRSSSSSSSCTSTAARPPKTCARRWPSCAPLLRTEVKEPRVLRFDPASRAVWSLAVLPDDKAGATERSHDQPLVELTNWADQVLKKRLENVRGVGAVNLVGATKREINIYLNPQALEAFGVTPDQVVAAVRNENQDLPVGAIRSLAQERVVQIDARMQRPEDFGRIIVAQGHGSRNGSQPRRAPGAAGPRARWRARGGEPGALQRPAHAAAVGAKVAGRKHHRGGRRPERRRGRAARQLPPGVRLETIGDSSRPIRVAVDNVRQTLIEGALLTVLIVFLFLNSWRSTVITG